MKAVQVWASLGQTTVEKGKQAGSRLNGRVAQIGSLSCRAQSRHLLLLVILKMRDSSTSLGMTKLGDPRVNRCRRFGQHAL
jgi:hypothetical protein